jgi:acyl dehydratase
MSTQEYRVRGLYFEELQVGDSMVTPGRTITETDLVNFCGLSGDFNQLHSNEEYARQSPFGKRIAHGMLGLSVASGLASRLGFMEGTAEAFMGLEWKFKHPLYIGDTVHLRAVVTNKREVKRLNGGLVVFRLELLNQDHVVLQQGEWTLLMKSRSSAS